MKRGLALKDVVVWAKGSRSSAAKDSFYKLVLVFKNGDAVQTNTLAPGQPGRTNIWEYAAVGASSYDLASHPAAKSTALVADAISDVTGRGAIVLDPFAGTGTTIIAAEKTGRHGRAIERDPRYCDVIVAEKTFSGPMFDVERLDWGTKLPVPLNRGFSTVHVQPPAGQTLQNP